MKSLFLLRHAKSAWEDGVERDFDRPLNERGQVAARAVGQAMSSTGLRFDHVLASPAKRVVQTIQEMVKTFGDIDLEYEQRLYLAPTQTLLDIVHGAEDWIGRLLLIGHNPGFEQLALLLGRPGPIRAQIAEKYPTATLVSISFPVDHWRDVAAGAGTLEHLIRPRDLDPRLGPEDF